ncbi:MAG TPA: M36 family metallopeptidase, partial [Kofleriaceae bacterium]|nr:M36 family metallopeptidase [Kofleriaceae bacterium]
SMRRSRVSLCSIRRRPSAPLVSLGALGALGLAGLSALGCATEPEAPAPVIAANPDADGAPLAALRPHWDALLAQTGTTPAVRWSAHGTPMSLFGTLSAPAAPPSMADARAFLTDHAQLLQLTGDPAELEPIASVDSPLGTHVTFAQRFQGVRVFGAEIKVHFDHDGRVVALSNTAVPRLALDTRPKISAARALDVALASVPAADRQDADPPEAPELVVYADAGAPVLAYRVVVPTTGPTLQFFVGANTGALVGQPIDINRYFVTGTGQVFKDNAVVATQDNNLVDNRDAASAVPSTAYSLVTLQGLNGNNLLDGQFASGSASKRRAAGTSNNFIFVRDNNAFSETMAYFHIDFAERYIQSLGFTNVNNRQQVFSVDRSTVDNSSYSPSTKRITYGTGGVDDAEDGEVIIHEYGHSVQDNQVPGFGSTEQGGAMGEGFGDYLAGTVNAALTGEFQLLCIAEWDATSYAAGVPHCLRRLDSAKHFPENADGEVHDDGEMWSASLFQIRTALGAAKADTLILQAHFLLSSRANFSDGGNALVTAAINLGFTATEVSTVRTILVNRGFTVTA